MTVTACYCDDCQQSLLETLMASRILRALQAQEASVVHGRDDGDFGDDDDGDETIAKERTVTHGER